MGVIRILQHLREVEKHFSICTQTYLKIGRKQECIIYRVWRGFGCRAFFVVGRGPLALAVRLRGSAARELGAQAGLLMDSMILELCRGTFTHEQE